MDLRRRCCPRDSHGANLACPGAKQHCRTCVERGSSRPDVIHQDHDAAVHVTIPRPVGENRRETERASHVPAARCGRKPRLRRRDPRAPQRVDPRYAEARCQFVGLVEPATEPPQGMQRDRYDTRGVGQQVGSSHADHRGQRNGKTAPPFVLERVKDGAKRSFVFGSGTPGGHERRMPAAPRTDFQCHADGSPGWQGIPAGAADWRKRVFYPCPARRADRAIERGVEYRVTGGATRRERDRQDGVGQGPANS